MRKGCEAWKAREGKRYILFILVGFKIERDIRSRSVDGLRTRLGLPSKAHVAWYVCCAVCHGGRLIWLMAVW